MAARGRVMSSPTHDNSAFREPSPYALRPQTAGGERCAHGVLSSAAHLPAGPVLLTVSACGRPLGAPVPIQRLPRILHAQIVNCGCRVTQEPDILCISRQGHAYEIRGQGERRGKSLTAGTTKRNNVSAAILPREKANYGTDFYTVSPAAGANTAQAATDIIAEARQLQKLRVITQPIPTIRRSNRLRMY